jgi:hypothetical protein
MDSKSTHKAQSAMEYLMTYGWAVLLIAVVLTVLFSIGLFNGNNVSPNLCQATPGFICTGAVYSHSDANIIVTIGQETGVNWIAANIVFVPQDTAYSASGVPSISFTHSPANTVLYTSGLTNGEEIMLYLPVNSVTWNPQNVIVGTPISGGIWAFYEYTYDTGGIQKIVTGYSQIAALNLKAA